MAEEEADILRAVRVGRSYRLGRVEIPAVRDVTVSIPAGRFVAFRGRSGSGKTTLLNLMGGLDRATTGAVYLKGRDLATIPERELTRLRRHDVGYVFQSFALLPTLSASENVEIPLRLTRALPAHRRRRVMECLDMVGLADRRDHRPYELSGGQQQRVAIARALANGPALILADEPTGELDSQSGRRILSLFRKIVEEQGVTVVVATHDPVADEYASVSYVLRDGLIEPGV